MRIKDLLKTWLSLWIKMWLIVFSAILHTLHLLTEDHSLFINWSIPRIFSSSLPSKDKSPQRWNGVLHLLCRNQVQPCSVQKIVIRFNWRMSLFLSLTNNSIYLVNNIPMASSQSWKGLWKQRFQWPWSPFTTHVGVPIYAWQKLVLNPFPIEINRLIVNS